MQYFSELVNQIRVAILLSYVKDSVISKHFVTIIFLNVNYV